MLGLFEERWLVGGECKSRIGKRKMMFLRR